MDIWFRWANKRATCADCKLPILQGEEEVVVRIWNKGNPDKRTFNQIFLKHVDCFILAGRDYLKRNPYQPSLGKKRGPKTTLTDEQRTERLKILQRHACLEKRKREAIENGLFDRASRYSDQLSELLIQIAPLGGIPQNWVEDIIQENSEE